MSTSLQPTAPELGTARLTLRGHRLEDFSASFAMWTDPVVTRFTIGKPSTEQEAWFRLLRYVGHWALMGFGYWVVVEKATGAFVGEVGFADFKREIEPSIQGIPELGWALVPSAHGKGYATEALKAVLDWGDARLGTARTVCLIDPENRASVRLAEKCGYREYARTTFRGGPTVILER